ncbi:hypothetical protein BKK81_15990 [Cupriavidus sp. USMAHM13]|uniref:hypothetical protein n=1 Tax=Cupriavidus sp. USMAHM13 TaxID=1389192 RepID=UPI0008A6BD40|nr:hypothetical protein [Cupriavidus sp. USMAHM13]AOZ00574.1 hypothetical protein BKK81_15990 [Cupriavidus sp. USMAHM13]
MTKAPRSLAGSLVCIFLVILVTWGIRAHRMPHLGHVIGGPLVAAALGERSDLAELSIELDHPPSCASAARAALTAHWRIDAAKVPSFQLWIVPPSGRAVLWHAGVSGMGDKRLEPVALERTQFLLVAGQTGRLLAAATLASPDCAAAGR